MPFLPPNFLSKARDVLLSPVQHPRDTSLSPNPNMGGFPQEKGGQTALSVFPFGCRKGFFSACRDHGQLEMLSLKKNIKEKKEGESTFGGKINCDGQTAHTPSAPTGQLEENLYVLTNTRTTDGAESLSPRPSRLAGLEQSGDSTWDTGQG